MAWRSFFAGQQQLFFWAINKTEVQKIDIKIKVEVSSWLWLDQRPYFCPNQDPEAVFLDFDLSKLSKYQFLFCFGVFFSSANCICLLEISKITEQKYSLLTGHFIQPQAYPQERNIVDILNTSYPGRKYVLLLSSLSKLYFKCLSKTIPNIPNRLQQN